MPRTVLSAGKTVMDKTVKKKSVFMCLSVGSNSVGSYFKTDGCL